jgi:spore maturation protein SpmB
MGVDLGAAKMAIRAVHRLTGCQLHQLCLQLRMSMAGVAEPLKRGLYNGISITWEMVKVIIPFYVVMALIKQTPLVEAIGTFFKPLMAAAGLPGEAALGLVAGYLVNLYAAIAVLTPLDLSAKDVTVAALMLGISHSLTIETPITYKTGANAWVLTLARIGLSFLSGAALNLIWKLFS